MNKEKFIEGVANLLEKCIGPGSSGGKATLQTVGMVKSIDEDKRLFTAVVLRPDVVDSHGDIYDAGTVEKACFDYNKFCRQGNLQHILQTELVIPVESWVSKASHTLGDGEVLVGDWLLTMEILDDAIWEECKKGTFTGFSIGCSSLVENLEDDNE